MVFESGPAGGAWPRARPAFSQPMDVGAGRVRRVSPGRLPGLGGGRDLSAATLPLSTRSIATLLVKALPMVHSSPHQCRVALKTIYYIFKFVCVCVRAQQ